MIERAELEATREGTDASLAEERGKTDQRRAAVAESIVHAGAGQAVAAERAETDRSLLDERHEADGAVDAATTLLVHEQGALSASRSDVGRRDAFLAMVSHDLRNPLTAIALDAQLIAHSAQEGPDGASTRAGAAEILASCERMRRMLADLLDVTTMESGALQVKLVRADLGRLVAEVVASFAARSEAAGPSLVADATDEPLLARFDPDRIRQVLENLVCNAKKFTKPDGSIALHASRRGAELLVCVQDTGVGIGAADLPHVFERFWHLERDGRGWGLGLYICKAIVEAHGGAIWASSVAGAGSAFSFTLPCS
jgi:chemotaxis family two-component system sensor kinase Cph1